MSDEHNIRAIAILILDEILQKNYSRDVVLARYFSKYELSEIDRDFIFNVVLNTLRFKEIFDEIITKVLNIRLQRIEPLIKTTMEVALGQILTMDRIPVYAAVSESIEGYKQIGRNSGGVGFLNFALRRLSRKGDLKELFERFKRENLLIYKLSDELKSELREDELQTIYKNSFERPPIFLRIREGFKIKSDIIPILEREKIDYRLSTIVSSSIILPPEISVKLLGKILPEDSFVLQSELSQLTAHLIPLEQGDRFLDVCSGNQIKSQQISEILKNHIDITSVDIKEIKNPKFKYIRADAQNIRFKDKFNKVLIDAPCSGLGTISQNPELKFKIKKTAIKRFSFIQYRILTNISQYLKSNGILLYSVCTITKSETTELIKIFLEENKQFEIIRPVIVNNELNRFLTEEGFLRIFNYNHQSFFYALLRRKY